MSPSPEFSATDGSHVRQEHLWCRYGLSNILEWAQELGTMIDGTNGEVRLPKELTVVLTKGLLHTMNSMPVLMACESSKCLKKSCFRCDGFRRSSVKVSHAAWRETLFRARPVWKSVPEVVEGNWGLRRLER